MRRRRRRAGASDNWRSPDLPRSSKEKFSARHRRLEQRDYGLYQSIPRMMDVLNILSIDRKHSRP